MSVTVSKTAKLKAKPSEKTKNAQAIITASRTLEQRLAQYDAHRHGGEVMAGILIETSVTHKKPKTS